MCNFYDRDEPREAEPSYEELLFEKEREISDTWLLVQNEAECDFEEADTDKMMKLLVDLRVMQTAKDTILESMDMRDEMRRRNGSI